MLQKTILFLLTLCLPLGASAAYGDTSKLIGKPYAGDGLDKMEAYLDFPEDLTMDSSGNMYIADTYDNSLRKIDSNGIVSTVFGTGSYGSADTELALPHGVGLDAAGTPYIADTENSRILKIVNGSATVIGSGFYYPEDVEISGSNIYVLDTGHNSLKKIANNQTTTLTDDLNSPKKMVLHDDTAYIANEGTHQILSVNLNSGSTTVVAGTGSAGKNNGDCEDATFNNIWGIAYINGDLYVADGNGFDDFLRKIELDGCAVSEWASDSNMVSINYPSGLNYYDGYVYVINAGIGTIHRFNFSDPNDNETYAGKERFQNQDGKNGLTGRPWAMTLDKDKRILYIAENNKIKKYNLRSKRMHYIAGSSVDNYKDAAEEKARFSNPTSLVRAGKILYITDRWNNRIRTLNTDTKTAGTLSGIGDTNTSGDDNNGYQEGAADKALFNHPAGITRYGKFLYVTDSGNNCVRRVNRHTGKTKLIAGQTTAGFTDGTGSSAQFNRPYGITISKTGTYLYVADTNNHALRKINRKTGETTTLVGTGSNGYLDGILSKAVLSYPENLIYNDRKIYFSEVGSQMVRLVDLRLGVTKLVSGSGERGYYQGSASTSEFNDPKGLEINTRKHKLFVADSLNDIIRKIDINGEAPYADPAPTVTELAPQSLKYSDYPTGYAMIEIHGSNFANGTKAYLGKYELTTYVQSATSLAVNVPIGDMAYGYYQCKVVNVDGQSATLVRAFSAQAYAGTVPEVDYWVE